MSKKDLIFKYLEPTKNDKLSLMSGLDLQDLIILLDDYYLKLRSSLGFDKSVTFGLEIEFENAMIRRIDDKLYSSFKGLWKTKTDTTLNRGAEISTPILHNEQKTWDQIKKVCKIVSSNASIGKISGGHIHIGAHVLGEKAISWINFIKLWSVYENIIYRFSYGDFLTARPNILKYAEPISWQLWDVCENIDLNINLDDLIYEIQLGKYKAVNFENVKDCKRDSMSNTIEFRCPNETLSPVIWQNNVNVFVKLLNYSKDVKFDSDIVEKRHQINSYKFNLYNEIYLEQVLEFRDMIFNNNLDKVYFLRQYLKSFEVGTKKFQKAKQFVKEYKH